MSDRERRVREWVEFLCSRECLGRRPGTPGSARARARIEAELRAAGAEPGGDLEEGSYLQEVPGCGFNVLARIPGAGHLAERAILVGAHYDHLGEACGHRVDGELEAFWGADDNAAAVAILLDLAHEWRLREGPRRQLILAAFDGEEPPHFVSETMGSMRFCARPTLPLDRIDTMLCMDLVGHALGPPGFPAAVRQLLLVLGAELGEGSAALVDAAAARAQGVVPRRLSLDVIPPLSDYYAFDRAGVPVLFLTCGRWEHYHQVSDTPEKLDYPKIVASADFLRDLCETLVTRPEAPVRHLPRGQDDAASVATLLELSEALRDRLPAIRLLRPVLQALSLRLKLGRLSPPERATLKALIGQVERAFE